MVRASGSGKFCNGYYNIRPYGQVTGGRAGDEGASSKACSTRPAALSRVGIQTGAGAVQRLLRLVQVLAIGAAVAHVRPAVAQEAAPATTELPAIEVTAPSPVVKPKRTTPTPGA